MFAEFHPMQILFETVLFCMAISAPALFASSFKSESAGRTEAQDSASSFDFTHKPAFRWLNRRKRAAAM